MRAPAWPQSFRRPRFIVSHLCLSVFTQNGEVLWHKSRPTASPAQTTVVVNLHVGCPLQFVVFGNLPRFKNTVNVNRVGRAVLRDLHYRRRALPSGRPTPPSVVLATAPYFAVFFGPCSNVTVPPTHPRKGSACPGATSRRGKRLFRHRPEKALQRSQLFAHVQRQPARVFAGLRVRG